MKKKSLRIIYKALYALTIVSMVASAALTAGATPAAAGHCEDWEYDPPGGGHTCEPDPDYCHDDSANNYHEEGECTFGEPEPELCEDANANNDGEEAPCLYTYYKVTGPTCDQVTDSEDPAPNGYTYGTCPEEDPGDQCEPPQQWNEETEECEDPGGGGGESTCPQDGGWVKIDSNDLSLYPVDDAVEYCFKAGSDNAQGCEGGLFSSWPQPDGTCGLSHWAYRLGEVDQVCEDETANNYGGELPCTYDEEVCEDETANNNGGELPCTYDVCEDQNAINVGQQEECEYYLCTDENAINYQENTTTNPEAESDCEYYLCTDENAINYHENTTTDPEAESDCIYNVASITDPGSASCGFFSFTIVNSTEGGASIPKVSWLVAPGGTTGTIEPLDVAQVLNFGPADPGTYTLYAWIGEQGDKDNADSTEQVKSTGGCEEPEIEIEREPEPEVEEQPVLIPVTGNPVLIPVTGLGDGNIYLGAQLANLGFGALAMAVIAHGFSLSKQDDED